MSVLIIHQMSDPIEQMFEQPRELPPTEAAPNPEPEPEPAPAPSPARKKKRTLTPEQKAVVLENLRKGRLKSAENRKKKTLAKKLQRQKQDQAVDDQIADAVLEKRRAAAQTHDSVLSKELEHLRNEIKGLRMADRTAAPPKAIPVPEPPKAIPVPEPPKAIPVVPEPPVVLSTYDQCPW